MGITVNILRFSKFNGRNGFFTSFKLIRPYRHYRYEQRCELAVNKPVSPQPTPTMSRRRTRDAFEGDQDDEGNDIPIGRRKTRRQTWLSARHLALNADEQLQLRQLNTTTSSPPVPSYCNCAVLLSYEFLLHRHPPVVIQFSKRYGMKHRVTLDEYIPLGKGQLPIHSAVWNSRSIGYIPLLAKEGITHQVGGHDNRGGLLVDDPRDNGRWNVLQLVVQLKRKTNPVPTDTACRNTMMELRESNLLLKEDIQEYDLLYYACHPGAQLRFDYFVDWDAQGLKNHQYDGLPITHAVIKDRPIESFQVFFKAALNHYPQDLGLLFQKDNAGEIACELAFDKFGKMKQ